MKKCVIYARVSSKEQEKGGYSIPAQIDFLTDYAKKHNFDIVKVYTEAETAKKSGRINFSKMVNLLKKSPEIKIILVEKTDRIYRNFKDYVILDEFEGLEVHLVKENMVISDNSPSHIKFMHGMKVLMAKNYIDNLSEEVQKGLNKKCKLGIYPSKAPVGYRNVVKDKLHIIEKDEESAYFIKKAFELYITTNYSYKTLAQELTKQGFRINGKPCRKHNIENIFDNPIYYGDFIRKGVLYKGVHEPIISKELFLAVQNKRKALDKPKKIKHNFIYSGLIKCSHCGCVLVGEIKKQKYIYYHCTGNKGGDCKKKYLKEEIIEKEIENILKSIHIKSEEQTQIIKAIKELIDIKENNEEKSIDNISRQIKVLKNRLNCAYIDKLDGKIPEKFYEEKCSQWTNELKELETELNILINTNYTFIKDCQNILELAENAYMYYKSGTNEQKQKIIKLLCSNLLFDGENLHIYINSTFETMLKSAVCHLTLGRKDSNL